MLNKIILFVVNQYSVIMQRNCPWLFMFAENLVTERLKGIDHALEKNAPSNTTPASNSLETNRTRVFQSRKYGMLILGRNSKGPYLLSLEDLDYAIVFLFKNLVHASLCSSSFFVNYWSCYDTIH